MTSRQDHKDVVAGSNSAFYKDSGLPANSAGVFAEIDPLQLNARNKTCFFDGCVSTVRKDSERLYSMLTIYN